MAQIDEWIARGPGEEGGVVNSNPDGSAERGALVRRTCGVGAVGTSAREPEPGAIRTVGWANDDAGLWTDVGTAVGSRLVTPRVGGFDGFVCGAADGVGVADGVLWQVLLSLGVSLGS